MLNLSQNEIILGDHFFSCRVMPGTATKVQKNRQKYGFAFTIMGSSKIKFSSGEVFTCNKNDIVFFPKGSNYTNHEDTVCEYSCYAINFDILADIDVKPSLIHVKDAARFFDLFKKAEKVFKAKKPWYLLKCKSILYEIFYLIYTEQTADYQNSKKAKIIEPSITYIQKNYYCEDLRVRELAKMCQITPEYYRKLFKSIYGCSPVKYIVNLRLERAYELLSSGLYTVTEAAEQSGYTDLSYFSRQFKKAYDVQPQSVRRQKP